MQNKMKLLLVVLVLSLAALACQTSNLNSQSSGDASAEGDSAASNILFRDDFSDPASGWDRVEGADGTSDYFEDRYRILINKANWYFWGNPGLDFSDVVIDVDAAKNSGPDENDFGVICRYLDEQNFYFFLVGSDGYYAVSKIINGEESLVGMDIMQFDDTAIIPGVAVNHLSARCVGESLSLSVNGEALVEVQDSDLDSGDVGLIVGSYDTAGVDILFDNFVVTRP